MDELVKGWQQGVMTLAIAKEFQEWTRQWDKKDK